MAYRKLDPPKNAPTHRDLTALTTPVKIYVVNGTTTVAAFPCWYCEVPNAVTAYHSIDAHDHWGWPDPRHPDRSCQIGPKFYTDNKGADLYPIHLLEEKYSQPEIVFESSASSAVKTNAWIENGSDWVVRASFEVHDQTAVSEQKEYPFVITIGMLDQNVIKRNDAVVRGVLVVLPAPIKP